MQAICAPTWWTSSIPVSDQDEAVTSELLADRDGQHGGFVPGGLRPSSARLLTQLVHQIDSRGIIITGSANQITTLKHFHDDFPTYWRSHDRQCPIAVLTDAAGRDICVLRGEIRAVNTSLPCPSVTFLEVDFVVAAVVRPDLENTFDVRFLYRVTI